MEIDGSGDENGLIKDKLDIKGGNERKKNLPREHELEEGGTGMKCSEEWALWVEMADGGSEVRKRTQRQWRSGAVDFYIFHIEGVPLGYHHNLKSTRICIMNFLLELEHPIIWKPISSAVLVDYVTSSALLVGDVTGLHPSLVSFTAMHKSCEEMSSDFTQSIIHCSRVSEAVAKEQPNSSGKQRTSACTVYAWHHVHNVCKLKLLTLKMVAQCFLYVCLFLNQWHWSESLIFVWFHSKQNLQQYKKTLYNKVVKTDLPEQWCWNAT